VDKYQVSRESTFAAVPVDHENLISLLADDQRWPQPSFVEKFD
jgi:hypothetical protein